MSTKAPQKSSATTSNSSEPSASSSLSEIKAYFFAKTAVHGHGLCKKCRMTIAFSSDGYSELWSHMEQHHADDYKRTEHCKRRNEAKEKEVMLGRWIWHAL